MPPTIAASKSLPRLRRDLGLVVPCKKGIEHDQFDGPDTGYVITRDVTRSICGCARLLPTLAPYLLANVFPQLLGAMAAPKTLRLWERSRFSTHVMRRSSGPLSREDARALLRAICGRCQDRGQARRDSTNHADRCGRRTHSAQHCRAGGDGREIGDPPTSLSAAVELRRDEKPGCLAQDLVRPPQLGILAFQLLQTRLVASDCHLCRRAVANPAFHCLGRTADLGGNRSDRLPPRSILVLVLTNHPDRTITHFR